jgi:hypothetical protein
VEALGRSLMLFGALLLVVGLLLYAGPSVPLLGKLPGDLRIERPGFRFFFPLTTCLLLSAAISALLFLIAKLR